jgi:hypothetical protein
MRYFFDLRTEKGVAGDPTGEVYASDEEALSAGEAEACGIAGDHLRDRCAVPAHVLVVRADDGRIVGEIEIVDLVKRLMS